MGVPEEVTEHDIDWGSVWQPIVEINNVEPAPITGCGRGAASIRLQVRRRVVSAKRTCPRQIERCSPPTDREREVLILRFGLDGSGGPRSLEEIGERFDLTLERIRQIEAKAMSMLRHPCAALDGAHEFLGS